MLKIVTDPTVYPIREVDLSSAADGLTLSANGSGRAQDLTWQRPDGGLNVAHRPRRMELELAASILEPAQVEAFQAVLGMTDYGAPRSSAYLFPPFDSSTILSLPLQGSTKGWARDPATGTLQPTNAAFSRGTTGFYSDRWGQFLSAAINVPRFTTGPMGRAIQLEMDLRNIMAVAEPTSGFLGWNPSTGTPLLEWDPLQRSPHVSAGGSMRLRRAKDVNAGIVTTINGTASATVTTRIRYSLWVRGNTRGTIQYLAGGQNEITAELVAYPDRWTRWDLEFSKTDAATSFVIFVKFLDDGQDRTVWVGPHLAHEYAEQTYQSPPPHWFSNATNPDLLTAPVHHSPGALTISVASRIPPTPARCRLWWTSGGGDWLTNEWAGTGLRFLPGSGSGGLYVQVGIDPAERAAAVGRPCVITARIGLGPDGISWRAQCQIAYTLQDGGPVLRWSNFIDDADVGDLSDSTNLSIGGGGANSPSELGLSWFRYDARTWTDAELIMWERCLLEAKFRDVFRFTQGRKFLLGDLELEGIDGTTYQRGVLPARELSTDPDLAVLT